MNGAPRAWRVSHLCARLFILGVLIVTFLPAASVPAMADDNSPADGDSILEPMGQGVSASGVPVRRVLADNAVAQDKFGSSLALAGSTMVVGSLYATRNSTTYRGAVYVFERDQGGAGRWGQIKELSPEEPSEYVQGFGRSVAIDGDIIVVGAYCAAVEWQTCRGSAYLYGRNVGGPGNWGKIKRLTASDGAEQEFFGIAVAIDGDTIAIGNLGTVNGNRSQGAVYIFERDAGGADNWGEVKKFSSDDGVEGDQFGVSLALSGSTLIVGVPMADPNGQEAQGAAYIFERDQGGAGNWGQVKKLIDPDGAPRDFFGESVAISGPNVVVGASRTDRHGTPEAGAVFIYGRNESGAGHWGQVRKLTAQAHANEEAGFGSSVAIDGGTLLVGAPRDRLGLKESVGAAYVFISDIGGEDNWGRVARMALGDGQTCDLFGTAVGVSGNDFAVGMPMETYCGTAGPGATYVYTLYSLRINSAGPKYVDKAGNVWRADRVYKAGAWGYVGGSVRTSTAAIANTKDDTLYQTERLWTGLARPGYKVELPNGSYKLMFRFAETYWNAAGKRAFTVMAEKKTCFSNYDIYIAAGGARNALAPDATCYADVSDGVLDIDFLSVLGQAKANAIYIQQLMQ